MTTYHYTECGLNNIYLVNGYKFIETPRGKSVSINDIDGLHKAIGLLLVTSKKDLSGEEIRFLRLELLMSQNTLAKLLGVSEQAIRRWEKGKLICLNHPNFYYDFFIENISTIKMGRFQRCLKK